jgi:histidinol-phosphatase
VLERAWGFESLRPHKWRFDAYASGVDHADALSFALDLARLGGRIALEHYLRDPATRTKDDGTLVSEADSAVEAEIRLRIARAFPDHNVLGEEEGLTAAGGGPPKPEAPTWIVDPIDGTNNYLAGIPIWATLIGFQINGIYSAGVAHAPALQETYDGAIGLGSRLNGTTIKVDAIDKLENATVLFADVRSFDDGGLKEFFDALTKSARRTRGLGEFWGHMLVAKGAAHVMVEPDLFVWDVAALIPIVAEAGGKLTPIDGTEWSERGSALTTCGSLHDEVVSLARLSN